MIFFPWVLPVEIEEQNVYFEVSAVIIAFVLLGKYMEEIVKRRSSAAVRKLLDLKPATARVIREGTEMEVPAESVMVDEVLVIRPERRCRRTARSSMAARPSTHRCSPASPCRSKRRRAPGDRRHAEPHRHAADQGTRVGADTALAQIIKLVEEAQASTAPVQRLADEVTRYFVPAVVGMAILAFAGWWLAGDFPQGCSRSSRC